MRLNRPRAALQDCGRALELNPDSGKAYKTRARANAKLKHWAAAHADFQEGLKIDYDDATYEESLSVAAKMKEITAVATARRVKEEADKERKQAREQELREQRARQQHEQQKAEADAARAKEEQAAAAKAQVLNDPLLRGLHQRAKKNGYMADFMGVKRGACSKCKHCDVYLWRPVKLSS